MHYSYLLSDSQTYLIFTWLTHYHSGFSLNGTFPEKAFMDISSNIVPLCPITFFFHRTYHYLKFSSLLFPTSFLF